MTHRDSTVASPSCLFTPRVLTGDRPTGQLHLGHFFGTLQNRVRLQEQGVDLLVLVADYQTITDRDSPASLPEDVEELVADYLAVGIDPARSTIFAHSLVPELNQLLLPFLSLVTLPELLRNPIVKEEAATLGDDGAERAHAHLPSHQAADILLSDAPVLLGTDGRKMSKSRNAIAASADETARLLRQAKTGSDPHITYDPDARPEVSNLVLLTALCEERDAGPNSSVTAAISEASCETGARCHAASRRTRSDR
ncbi:MAG TPA: hypothetical protein VG325_07515 [Solirubrobacteraceae bacterium]|nr:hypothetical protein [Solirubrobacteraceae bacterium]